MRAITRKSTQGMACSALLALVMEAEALGQGPQDYNKPSESDVAYIIANAIEYAHFSHRAPDDLFSSQFFDGYVDALDAAHLVLFQSDIDEFNWFRPELGLMTLNEGATWPARLIYLRYRERLAEKENFQTNFLRTSKFNFSGYDTWQPDRHDLLRPQDLSAAQKLWREEVRADYLQEKLAGLSPAQIVARLRERYQRRRQAMSGLDGNTVLEIYLDAFAHALDPHSDYFGHEEAVEFNDELNLSLSGIGGSLEAADDGWRVSDLVPGGPADRSGLIHLGDRILAVAQGEAEAEDVTDLPSSQVVNLIRGPKGSTVRLTIIPAGKSPSATETVSLVRDDINLADEYVVASVIELPSTHGTTCRVGVISLPLLYEKSDSNAGGASVDTARLIKKLKEQGVEGLILDLRRNGGGSVQEAIGLAGLFMPTGPVVQMRDAKGRIETASSPETNVFYDDPLVVLTSRFTASGAEIVAGALQDCGRALVVGDSSTFGKGTVQILVPFKKLAHYSGFGEVKVTIAKFYRPSGGSIQIKGVIPDIILPSETDLADVGEARLPNALPWDTAPGVIHTNFNRVSPVLASLREKSQGRLASDPCFRLLGKELAARAADEANSLVLNESIRRREKAGHDLFQEEISKAWQAESGSARRVYEIALADAADTARLAERGPAFDPDLNETENILADYIELLQARLGRPAVTVGPTEAMAP